MPPTDKALQLKFQGTVMGDAQTLVHLVNSSGGGDHRSRDSSDPVHLTVLVLDPLVSLVCKFAHGIEELELNGVALMSTGAWLVLLILHQSLTCMCDLGLDLKERIRDACDDYLSPLTTQLSIGGVHIADDVLLIDYDLENNAVITVLENSHRGSPLLAVDTGALTLAIHTRAPALAVDTVVVQNIVDI